MKPLRYITLLLIIFGGCNQPSNENIGRKPDSTTSTTLTNDTVPKKDIVEQPDTLVREDKIEKTDFNFLSDCDSLQMWRGGIVGVKKSDSTGPYIMAQCFANKHYDIIVYSSEKIELKEGADYKAGVIRSGIPKAEYYAFEIPKQIPEEPENEFDTYDYIFPNEVKVYRLFEDGWYLIRKANVNSFEELGRLKLNSIYKQR